MADVSSSLARGQVRTRPQPERPSKCINPFWGLFFFSRQLFLFFQSSSTSPGWVAGPGFRCAEGGLWNSPVFVQHNFPLQITVTGYCLCLRTGNTATVLLTSSSSLRWTQMYSYSHKWMSRYEQSFHLYACSVVSDSLPPMGFSRQEYLSGSLSLWESK